MTVRSRSATGNPNGARLSMDLECPSADRHRWPKRRRRLGSSPGATVTTTSRGDTALVEIALRRVAGAALHLHPDRQRRIVGRAARPLVRASRELEAALSPGIRALAADNAAAWARRWETDIGIEGNPELQRVVRSMLFYLLCSADSGTALGIPPMGLSSGGYYGHIFWDSDTWMFPSAAADPSRRRPLAGGLPRPHARRGAEPTRGPTASGERCTPGRPTSRGTETTPHFAVQNARSEIHVTGDVALAQWQYYLATGDSAWLAREGFPVIRGDGRLLGQPRDARLDHRPLPHRQRGLGGRGADRRDRRRVHQRGRPEEPRDRDGGEPAAGAGARPALGGLAGKLHLPYDSASEFYRTYEGAPDSTLGDVTPLLAYPLGLTMSARPSGPSSSRRSDCC